MNYYIEPLKKYAVFEGRARRKEYWSFFLFCLLVGFAIGIIGVFAGFSANEINTVSNILQLGLIVPSIAVGIRRMHDVNKSGWFILIPFYNLILACTPGTIGPNTYGPDPKEISPAQEAPLN